MNIDKLHPTKPQNYIRLKDGGSIGIELLSQEEIIEYADKNKAELLKNWNRRTKGEHKQK